MKETFGKRLKELRLENHLSQTQLAKAVGVGKSVVSLWEQDACQPSLEKAAACAVYFKVSLDYLACLID